jgi:hypothetical protein
MRILKSFIKGYNANYVRLDWKKGEKMMKDKLKDLITIKQRTLKNGDLLIFGSLTFTCESTIPQDDLKLRKDSLHERTERIKTEILHKFYTKFYGSLKMGFPELYSLIRLLLHERGFNFAQSEEQYYRFHEDKDRVLLLLDQLSNKLQF